MERSMVMSDSRADWRSALSFSDRLANRTQIASAFKISSPDCDSNQAAKHAKEQEELARKTSLSALEYHQHCSEIVKLLLANTVSSPVVDQHADEHIFPNLPEHGATIGKYTNAHHHRDGLFSEVFKARDLDHPEKMVALKIATPSAMTPPHDSAREARILHGLNGNNIIQLQETFQQSGGHFVLVFPYQNFDLATLLIRNGLTEQSRKSILRDLFTALSFIHSQGIIHRDIKPSNILLATESGPAYLADFGIAWSPTDPASESADAKILDVGTTCYRPPELLFGRQNYDEKLDLWAAGCVAAQVITLGKHSLFDAGDLGSELALIKSIFETLGTPDLERWPEAESMPDWGKMNFVKYPEKSWDQILPNTSASARDLVERLVVYQSTDREPASKVLQHAYLAKNSSTS